MDRSKKKEQLIKESIMKGLILFFILSYVAYAQVNGCQFIGELDSVGTNTHSCYNEYQFAVLTITLGASTDTVLVSIGTNLEDSTVAQQEYGQMMVIDAYDGSDVTVITGNTTANRKYFFKWAYKQKHIKLAAPTGGNDNDIPYILEFY